MKKETRTIIYDEELKIEAYRFEGVVQPFPNHFHEYYVIGFMEDGTRCLSCKNRDYTISKGNMLLFNPGDNHGCVQNDGCTLDYRGLNISKDAMMDFAEEITGDHVLPVFTENVIYDEDLSKSLRSIHEMIMTGSEEFLKEETLLLLLSELFQRYGQSFTPDSSICRKEIELACAFINSHCTEHLHLDQICRYAGLSKSTLLREFTKAKGVSPYLYLQNIRIGKAKTLLECGASPIDAALETGFTDQSHFTKYFHRFIGLSPGTYRDIFLEAKETKEIKESRGKK